MLCFRSVCVHVFCVNIYIFREAIIREVHRRQMWEHAVLVHIRHNRGEMSKLLQKYVEINASVANKYEELAIKILEERTLSPLDLSTDESNIRRKQVESWMNRVYHPLNEWKPGIQPRMSMFDNLSTETPSILSSQLDEISSINNSSIGIANISKIEEKSELSNEFNIISNPPPFVSPTPPPKVYLKQMYEASDATAVTTSTTTTTVKSIGPSPSSSPIPSMRIQIMPPE
jgi:hypothetical protein